MHKGSLYYLIAAVLLVAAFTANRASGRLPDVKLRQANIMLLPHRIGSWTCVREAAEEEIEHRAVPAAVFHRWYFRDLQGHEVELLLETASEADGYHNPTVCMTAQNWEIVAKIPTSVHPENQTPAAGSGPPAPPATLMRMYLRDHDLKEILLYWHTRDLQLDKLHQFVTHDMTGIAPSCLFVRIAANAAQGYDQATAIAQRFATDAFPVVASLTQPR